jgi:hypothetical protein
VTKIREGAALGRLEKFGFMTGTMQNPFFVKLGAMQLSEYPVFQNSFAAQCGQTGNKKGQWAKCDESDDHSEGNGWQHEILQVGAVIKDVVSPGCSNYRRGGKSDGREDRWGEAEEPKASAFIRMRRTNCKLRCDNLNAKIAQSSHFQRLTPSKN